MSSYRPLAAVVLAAGEGSRIRSGTPKVLHELCGRPMVLHVVDALAELPLERVVIVVGHSAERVTKTLQEQLVTEVEVEFVEQHVQRGTGDAVSVALTSSAFDDLDAEDDILVLPGDHPLLSAETIAMLATEHRVQDAAATVLTVHATDPTGYGRVIRDKDDRVARIVEHADADDDERAVDEINTSIYCFRRNLLAPALRRLSPENAQGEYYLTDAIEVLRAAGHKVIAVTADDPAAAMGVNDRVQLADAEAALRGRINRRWMLDGVTMVDPSRTYVDATVALEPDVRLLPGTILEGRSSIAAGSVIGPDSHLVDTVVGERSVVANSVARDVEIGDDCQVGPFAYLRPGTRLANGAKAGTFVEIKNSDVGEGTKVPHLSYVGDAEIGANVNLGASTITANYDGVDKHKTRIGDGVHTSIHTSLVAPVELGDGSETGAGAVVTHDVPPGRLVKGVPARDSRAAGRKSREDADDDPEPQAAEQGSLMEVLTKKNLIVVAGRGHPELSTEVAQHLHIPLAEVALSTFANGEIYCRYGENIRGADVFVFQSHADAINDRLMEQLIMIDAAKRASAKRITAVSPFYGYSRQDRKAEGREPITARLVADMYTVAGADRVVTVDLHTGQIQGFFDFPVDHLTAVPVLVDYLARELPSGPITVVAPDAGGGKLARRFADRLNAEIAFIDKRRPKGTHNVAVATEVVGEIKGRTCVIVDDIIDTASTVVSAADLLLDRGASDVLIAATHGLLSGPAVDRLKNSRVKGVVVTNTVPVADDKRFDSLEVLSIAPLLANAIRAVFEDRSVSELFGGDNV